MGRTYEFHCMDCGCKETGRQGIGTVSFIESEELKISLKKGNSGKSHKKIQVLYNAMYLDVEGSKEPNVLKEYEVFFCKKCNHIFDEERVVISNQFFEIKEQSVKCPTCYEDGVLLQNMVGDEENIYTKKSVMCPVCFGDMRIRLLTLWD